MGGRAAVGGGDSRPSMGFGGGGVLVDRDGAAGSGVPGEAIAGGAGRVGKPRLSDRPSPGLTPAATGGDGCVSVGGDA